MKMFTNVVGAGGAGAPAPGETARIDPPSPSQVDRRALLRGRFAVSAETPP